MRQRPCPSHRSSNALRTAAAVAAAVPVLALAPGIPAAADSGTPDLVVSELPTAPQLQPGQTRQGSVTLTNNGTAAAHDIVFRVRLSPGLDFPAHQDGCRYTATSSRREALCTLGLTVEPGAKADVPLPLKARSDAFMETVEYGTSPTGDTPGEGFDESYRRTTLTTSTGADLAAVGDHAKGRPGGTVTVRPTLRNNGPGRVHITDSDDQPALMVNIPKGTVAVRVPSDCVPFAIDGPSGPSQPGKSQYVCSPADYILEAGSVHAYSFRLRLERGTRTASAEVRATSVYDIHPKYDHNASNDASTISVSTGHGHDHPDADGAGPASGAPSAGEKETHPSAAADTPKAWDGSNSDVKLAADAHDDTAPAGSTAPTSLLAAGGAAVAAGLAGAVYLTVRRRRAQQSS